MDANHQERPTDRSPGFTLIELLTVILVLGILAGLSLTAVARAKRSAHSAVCRNNLKQMGIWMSAFVMESSEYPLGFNAELTNQYPGHAITWQGSLRRMGGYSDVIYEGDGGDIFNCPSAKRPSDLGPYEGYGSYGYNADGIIGAANNPPLGLGGKGGEQGAGYPPPVKASEVANPSEMLAIGDSFIGWKTFIVEGRKDHIGLIFTLSAREGETSRALARHSQAGNYLLCDTHVEAIRLDKLFFNAAREDARLWNRDNQPHLERLW